MADLGTGGIISVGVISTIKGDKIISYNTNFCNVGVLTIQKGNTVSMVKSSRLFLATQETTGNGENLTQKAFQYWG